MRTNRGSSLAGLAIIIVLVVALLATTAPTGAQNGAPAVVSYLGQVTVDSSPYDGSGYFKFAIVDQAGTTSTWSKDVTSSGGSEPSTAVSLTVSNGLFTVLLGDTDLTT